MDRNDCPAPTYTDDAICHCPVCKSENVHLQAVEVNAGGVVTRIDYQQPTVRDGPPWGRGTLIRILMWAECGHSWTVEFYFHKGQTWAEMFQTQQDYDKLTDMWRE